MHTWKQFSFWVAKNQDVISVKYVVKQCPYRIFCSSGQARVFFIRMTKLQCKHEDSHPKIPFLIYTKYGILLCLLTKTVMYFWCKLLSNLHLVGQHKLYFLRTAYQYLLMTQLHTCICPHNSVWLYALRSCSTTGTILASADSCYLTDNISKRYWPKCGFLLTLQPYIRLQHLESMACPTDLKAN